MILHNFGKVLKRDERGFWLVLSVFYFYPLSKISLLLGQENLLSYDRTFFLSFSIKKHEVRIS